MKTITTYIRAGRKFQIVKDTQNGGTWYMAVEDKYIDEDGRLNTELNGMQTFANKTVDGCIQALTHKVDYDAFIAKGMTKAEAFAETFNIPLHMAEQMIAR